MRIRFPFIVFAVFGFGFLLLLLLLLLEFSYSLRPSLVDEIPTYHAYRYLSGTLNRPITSKAPIQSKRHGDQHRAQSDAPNQAHNDNNRREAFPTRVVVVMALNSHTG